eukprot:Skav232465  [mRNA]  locus=scaffold2877:82413:82873:- [translate_table: standard]
MSKAGPTQATDGMPIDQQAHSGCLWSVSQGTQGSEGSNQEVAMSHSDLQATLPWLQALTVEGQVAQVLLAPATILQECLHLITCERLLALPLNDGTSVPVSCWTRNSKSIMSR